MFEKILIANRGEIAVRVARTAKALGVKTVAVYSDADDGAPHMRACDEAVHIGPAPAAESYLCTDKILEAAKRAGAQAVHPGYGFLSENAAFADALDAAGIVFIGPTAETIRAMGSKSAAKDLMAGAGVPTTPGYQGADQSVATFRAEAGRIGYPVLLKATAGGGGKGMRLVERESELEEALGSAQREAVSAFGDDRFLLEKYIARARHLEVQIFGDGRGEVVHLFERDCSVQRRHQKVIEEAPAPNLPPSVREALLKAGVEAGRAVDYRGAGTVEFLYDETDQAVYFMEMNTRLQVEHPVSEMITGLDFVEWQLRIAAGEPLPLTQDAIMETGHAFEARLYAENPEQDFAPSTGTLTTLRLPFSGARLDSGVEEGQAITPYYDPMIAKIITRGAGRKEALGALRAALSQTRVAGVETNARFLHALAAAPAFAAGTVSTRFIDDHREALIASEAAGPAVWAAAALWKRKRTQQRSRDPWASLSGFRLNRPYHEILWIEHQGAPALLRLERTANGFNATLEPDASAAARREGREPSAPIRFSFSGEASGGNAGNAGTGGEILFSLDGETIAAFAAPHGGRDRLRVWIGARAFDVAFADPLAGVSANPSSEGSLTAPMPGVVTLLAAAPGEAVPAGGTLLVMEAMKMEHAIKAPCDGVVKAHRFQPGDQVNDGDLLVEFEESP